MSCQRRHTACSACCGLWNLELKEEVLEQLLQSRTLEFQVQQEESWRPFRLRREASEAGIGRYDPEVYVCPFLGYIDGKKTGCLVHPERTGVANSQNYSFYGASICQSYDCYPKESDVSGLWAGFLEQFFPAEYGRLMGDVSLYKALKQHLPLEHMLENPAQKDWLACICQLRLETNEPVHSFEIQKLPAPGLEAALLDLKLDRARLEVILTEALIRIPRK